MQMVDGDPDATSRGTTSGREPCHARKSDPRCTLLYLPASQDYVFNCCLLKDGLQKAILPSRD